MARRAVSGAALIILALVVYACSRNVEPHCSGGGNVCDERATVDLASTLYYAAMEDDYPRGSGAAFRDMEGHNLHKGSRGFLDAASIEGTAVFADGTVLNVEDFVGNEVRWVRVRSSTGIDAMGCSLVPLRSVAVDPRLIPLGTKLDIRETVGLPLPGGGTHDGIWYATDVGEGIKGKRIDLFTGRGMAAMDIIYDAGITHMQRLHTELRGHTSLCAVNHTFM